MGQCKGRNKIKGKKKKRKGNARPGKEGRRNVTAKWAGREGEGKTRTVNKHEWGGTERKAKERYGNDGETRRNRGWRLVAVAARAAAQAKEGWGDET